MPTMQTKCHICSNTANNAASVEECPKCGTSLSNPKDEFLIKAAGCDYSLSLKGMGKLGDLYLTNKRLICFDRMAKEIVGRLFRESGGMAAGSLASKLVSTKEGFSLSLDDIDSFENGKFGLITKAFVIKTKGGETVRLRAKPLDEWVQAIKDAKA